ncbi:hypothetical protein I4U23_012812 [Adineta vaga]|nr:hypothetical protein I4U23_012812 [Adineta vaga]
MARNEETKLKDNMSTHRRLNIQHKMEENNLKQDHLLTLKSYQYREGMFHQRIDQLKKNIERIQPHVDNDMNDQQKLRIPNNFAHIKTQFHLLNISTQTQKRLLCQVPEYNKPKKQKTNHFPLIPHRSHTNEIDKCLQRLSFFRTRAPIIYSCQSNSNDEKVFQTFLKQQIVNEHKNQRNHNERKAILLKEFDQLKHTIDDPHSTSSALAALSRALLDLEFGTK